MNFKKLSVGIMSMLIASISLFPAIGFSAQDDETAQATATLGNTVPTTLLDTVTNANYDPTSNSTTAVTIKWNCTDANGVADLNDAIANFTVYTDSGRAIEHTSDTSPTTEDSGDTRRYTASINMNYYDTSQMYYVRVTCGDEAGAINNDTDSFTYNKLEDVVVPATISFGTIEEGQADISSGEQIITNVGNVNLDFNITGANLVGQTVGTEFIAIGNFTIDDDATTDEGAETENTELTLTTNSQLYSPYDTGDYLGNIAKGSSGNIYSAYFFLDMPTNGYTEQVFAGNWTLTGYEDV